MRRIFLILMVAPAASQHGPRPAHADELIATVARPTPLGAIDGRIVWSDYDPAVSRYFLTQRLNGVTSRLPVPPRAVPFDLDLGPDADGRPVAAYSRCRHDPPRRGPPRGTLAQLPEWRLGRGCDLYLYSFDQGREVLVRFASTRTASEFLPTVWTDRIAFARRYERRRGRAGRRAFLYVRPNSLFTTQGRRGNTRRLPGGPGTGPGPTALDIATRRLTFGWDSTDPRPYSQIYLDVMRNTGRTAQRSLDRGHSGEMQGREFIAPQFDEQVRVNWLASYTGDMTTAYVRRYSFMEDRNTQARIPAVPVDPTLRPPIAGAVDGAGYLYLESGFTDPEEPCNVPGVCIGLPGCDELRPCRLRRATGLTFGLPVR